MSKKYSLNLLVSLLSFFIITIFVLIFMESNYFDSTLLIIVFCLFCVCYVSKIKVKNRYINKIVSIISVLLFLFTTGVIVINAFVLFTNVSNQEEIYSPNEWIFTFNLYYLLRIFVDSIINFRKKEFNFSCILRIISLAIIDLVLFRLLIDKILYRSSLISVDLYEVLSQNNVFFFIMLFVCIINENNYVSSFKSRIEDITKVVIAVVVSLTILSLIDTLEIYVVSDEYQPIICFHETHSEEKSTYYSFGYSITYYYGEEFVTEYRLFNLIPFYKK